MFKSRRPVRFPFFPKAQYEEELQQEAGEEKPKAEFLAWVTTVGGKPPRDVYAWVDPFEGESL